MVFVHIRNSLTKSNLTKWNYNLNSLTSLNGKIFTCQFINICTKCDGCHNALTWLLVHLNFFGPIKMKLLNWRNLKETRILPHSNRPSLGFWHAYLNMSYGISNCNSRLPMVILVERCNLLNDHVLIYSWCYMFYFICG
jgi:hypothetical protein